MNPCTAFALRALRALRAPRHRLRRAVAAGVVLVCFVAAGCGVPSGGNRGPLVDEGVVGGQQSSVADPAQPASDPAAPPSVAAPGPLTGSLHSSDLLVYGANTLTPGQ